MDKGQLVGRGRTADIYAWGNTQVLKLFKDGRPDGMVQQELRIARTVQVAGLPVPKVQDNIVQVDGRYGLIYERVSGPSMLVCLRQQPWKVVTFGRLLADIQATIHACAAPDLPVWKERLERDIRAAPLLTESARQAVLQALAALPGGSALCHGDFHPDNVIMTRHGPVVIDWMTAVCGNPAADVARTSALLRLGEIPPGTPLRSLINLLRGMFHRVYLDHYLHRSHLTHAAVNVWELPIVAARLTEGIENEQSGLLRLVTLHTRSA
jgi:uncharacterized protein (TIGR02172 family)